MQVRLTKYCGFCFGVKRAVELVQKSLEIKNSRIYSIGQFIHNPQVIEELSNKGLKVVNSLKNVKDGKIVIRSHGVHPSLIEKIKKRNIQLIDVTCPYVRKAQHISKFLKDKGYEVVIVGEKKHPEVQALKGFAKDDAFVVKDETEVDKLKLAGKKVGVIAQTTQSKYNYLKVISKLMEKDLFEIRIFNTICVDTIKRQESAKDIAKTSDVMLILGGKMSANSNRLAEICRATGTETHHIEVVGQLRKYWFVGKRRVGITSGASTPKWIINEVIYALKKWYQTKSDKVSFMKR